MSNVVTAVKALSFAHEICIFSIILEGDLEIIISSFGGKDESFDSFGHMISIFKILKEEFRSISFHMFSDKEFLSFITLPDMLIILWVYWCE